MIVLLIRGFSIRNTPKFCRDMWKCSSERCPSYGVSVKRFQCMYVSVERREYFLLIFSGQLFYRCVCLIKLGRSLDFCSVVSNQGKLESNN